MVSEKKAENVETDIGNENNKRDNFIKKIFSEIGAFINTKPIPSAVIISFIIAILNEILSRRTLFGTVKFMFVSPAQFLCNVAVIMIFEAFALLFKKRNYLIGLFSFIWLGLGITNFIVRSFRQTPFSAMDFTLVKSVFPILIVYLTWYGLIGCILLIIAAIIGIFITWKKAKKMPGRFKTSLITFVVSLLSGVVLLETLYLGGIIPKRFSNLADAYRDYGFSYCFAVSVVDRGIKKPSGYETEIDNVVSDVLDEKNENAEKRKNENPNVIFVQLESFYDLNLLKGFEFENDPTPSFTELKNTSAHGILTVPSIGAGTANTEFEVLTGMSLQFFGAGEYPYETILQKKTCESVCYNLKKLGYSAHAVHNYKGNFYDRSGVFGNLGFDTFTSIEYMSGYRENMLGWADDMVLAGCVMDALESTDTQDVVYCISVQAHGKYPTSDYDAEEHNVVITAYPEDANTFSFDYFADQIHGTDEFIGSLITSVKSLGEDTIIVFFGDHIPNIGFEDEWLPEGMTAHDTEYVIWNNFGAEITDCPEKLTSYQLSAYVLSLFGCDEGVVTKLHQTKMDSEHYMKYLEMLEYDILYGDCVAYGGEIPFEKTDLKMGVKDIVITSIENYGDSAYIRGKNFTEASKVFLNGTPRSTKFVDENTLMLKDIRVDDGDEVKVVQIADLIFRLSQTEEYVYRAEIP